MPLIRTEHDGAVAIVRFDNPPRGYLNAAQTRELAAVMEARSTRRHTSDSKHRLQAITRRGRKKHPSRHRSYRSVQQIIRDTSGETASSPPSARHAETIPVHILGPNMRAGGG